MNARSFFQGLAAFNADVRFRDNPYRFDSATDDLLAWYVGWSTAFDLTWRKLTLGQRCRMILGSAHKERARGEQLRRPPLTTHRP